MFRIINVFPILREYWKHLRQDLNIIPLIVNILILPVLLSFLIYKATYEDKNSFFDSLRNINAIILPLLINVLMIVQYSIGKAKGSKILFLKHIKSSISVGILVSISLILFSFFPNFYIYLLSLFLFSFLIINFLIILKRINILIDLETDDSKSS